MTDTQTEPRPMTAEEARAEFLDAIRRSAKYWAELPDRTPQERCDGLAHSILAIIDGSTYLPGLEIRLSPHPTDKNFHQSIGANWYEDGQVINNCSLAGEYFK